MAEQVKKTEDDYYEEYIKKNKTWAQETYDAQSAEQQAISDAYLDGVTEAIKKNKNHAVGKINTQIAELPTLYQAAFDANAVQEEVNKRKAREHMANLGLTDSGLNQMQQTSFMISKQNADYALNQKKAAAVASLQQQIADLENEAAVRAMEAETQEKARLASEKSKLKASLDADAETNARAAAKYAYQEDQNREAAIKKAEIEALAKQAEARYEIGDLNANGVLDPDEIETLITKYKLENGEYDDVVAAYTPIQDQDGNTGYLGYTGLEEQKAASAEKEGHINTAKGKKDIIDAYYYIESLTGYTEEELLKMFDEVKKSFAPSTYTFQQGQYWVLEDDGSRNWGGGINRNAKVSTTDASGRRKTYTLGELFRIYKNYYASKGVRKCAEEAKDTVLAIQRAFGIEE